MKVIDVDSHFHEPVDWLKYADRKLYDELGDPLRFMDFVGVLFGLPDPALVALPEKQQPRGDLGHAPQGMVEHYKMADTRQPQVQEVSSGNPYYDSDARIKFCDDHGIDIQFMNPTFMAGVMIQAMRAGRMDVNQKIRAAWNQWSIDQLDGKMDRLIPVTQIDLADIDWSIKEMTKMRKAGSLAFAITEAPVVSGNYGIIESSLNEKASGAAASAPLGKSISHPDFDPIWSAAEDLGMTAMAHVGFSQERIDPGWANNGADHLFTYFSLNGMMQQLTGPQLVLGAMAYDGVFERHPKLNIVTAEVGATWLPQFLAGIDFPAEGWYDVGDGIERPSSKAQYNLPLKPSEYIERQVRTAPLITMERIDKLIDLVPTGMLAFSTDYPHVEGAEDAVKLFDDQLTNTSQEKREDFFGGIGKVMGL